MIPFEIQNLRTGNFKGATKAFFDIAFGYTVKKAFTPLFVVKDFMLTTAKNGDFFILGPFKYRVDGEGEKVKNKQGFFMRDEFWQPIWEGAAGSRALNEDSQAYREELIAAAVDAYNDAEAEPAPKREAKPAARKEAVAATTGSASRRGTPVTTAGDDDDDSDLPF